MTDLDTALPCECPVSTCPELIDHYSACPAYYRPALEKLREADKARIAEAEKRAARNWKAYEAAEEERRHHARLSYQYMKEAEAAEARAEKLEGALREARRALPDDRPALNSPWSLAIAIIDEALEEAGQDETASVVCEICEGSRRQISDNGFPKGHPMRFEIDMPCPNCIDAALQEAAPCETCAPPNGDGRGKVYKGEHGFKGFEIWGPCPNPSCPARKP